MLGQIWSRRSRRKNMQAQRTFVTNMSIVLDNKMLCDEFGIVEPAHACCTPYLAVYSTLYCFTGVVSVMTVHNIMATTQNNHFRQLWSGWTVCWPPVGLE